MGGQNGQKPFMSRPVVYGIFVSSSDTFHCIVSYENQSGVLLLLLTRLTKFPLLPKQLQLIPL